MKPFKHILALALVCLAFGCGRRDASMVTGERLADWQLRALFKGQTFLGDESYAVVNSEWLAAHQADFEARLSAMGNPMRYESRFDCNRFVQKFVADAQAKYMVATWHAENPPKALAIGEVWGLRPTGLHALVVVVTERGVVYWEPQLTDRHEVAPLNETSFRRF